ncbi:unnamed protein product, partial [Mesorhabditis spiculigera]
MQLLWRLLLFEALSIVIAGNDEGEFDGESWDLPDNIQIQNDTFDHVYYKVNTLLRDGKAVDQKWVDVENMLKTPGAIGNVSHALLTGTHRRAVGIRLQFEFPFYGHIMKNVTIATGGFLYVGDQTHNWLAATQYIAPLMANFNTLREGSGVLYADDGQRFVCEWRQVQLRGQESVGPFTFQLHLHKNGNITFLYKDVPLAVANISEDHHPVKLGISDAYLFQHPPEGPNKDIEPPKRVIYEYHRIEIPESNVVAPALIQLEASPTCHLFKTCAECSNATIPHFNCTWCHAKKENGGPFCTDEGGVHRKRQQWVDNNCKAQGLAVYCAEDDNKEVVDPNGSDAVLNDGVFPPVQTTTAGVEPNPEADKLNPKGSGGISTLLIVCICIVIFVSWLGYAYYNPHTSSGQLLIKYRPSRWRAPMSHVRYSASVHM